MEWTLVWTIFIDLVPSIWKSGQKLLSGGISRGGFDDMTPKYNFNESVKKVHILWIDDMFDDNADPFCQFVHGFKENHNYIIKCRSMAQLSDAQDFHIVLCDFEKVGDMGVDHTRSNASNYLRAFPKMYFDKELYFVSGLTSFKTPDASEGFKSWNKSELANGSNLDFRLQVAVEDYIDPKNYWKRAARNMAESLRIKDAWIEEVKRAFVADYLRTCRNLRNNRAVETPKLLRLKQREPDKSRCECLDKLIEYIKL